MKYKLNIKNIIYTISIVFLMFIIMNKSLIETIFGNWHYVYVIISICILGMLFISLLRYNTIFFKKNKFSFFLILTFVPILFNNYSIKSGNYNYIIIIGFTCVILLLLEVEKLNPKSLKIAGLVICILSVIFAIVTWISFLNPTFYYGNIVPLFQKDIQETLIYNYQNYGMLAGLTDHYSRNAYYIMLGCMLLFINFKESKFKLINIATIVFLATTLLLIGKRGHLIFFSLALIIVYSVKYGIGIRTLITNIFKIALILVGVFVIINTIPGTNNFINRLLNSSGDDITSGRTYLYGRAIELISNTYFIGDGWGSFADYLNGQYAGVHNDYLQLLCEVGIWGFTIYMIFHVYVFKKTLRFFKDNVNNPKVTSICMFSLGFQIFFLLYSFTGIPHYDYEVYVVYLLAAGIPWILDTGNNSFVQGRG